jgi:hypothetical protein
MGDPFCSTLKTVALQHKNMFKVSQMQNGKFKGPQGRACDIIHNGSAAGAGLAYLSKENLLLITSARDGKQGSRPAVAV